LFVTKRAHKPRWGKFLGGLGKEQSGSNRRLRQQTVMAERVWGKKKPQVRSYEEVPLGHL